MRCWNCRRPSGYREQALKAIGALLLHLLMMESWKKRSRNWIHCRQKALPPVTVIWLRQRSCPFDWQGAKQAEQRDYRQAENCYASAVEKYRQAQANGTEDTQMAVLKNLIDQLRTSGWLK